MLDKVAILCESGRILLLVLRNPNSFCKNHRCDHKQFCHLRARLHEPGLAANPGQVASQGPPFSSQMLVQLQAFDWNRWTWAGDLTRVGSQPGFM